MSEIHTRLLPSGLPPSEAELAAWQALSREQQLAGTREVLLAPEVARQTAATCPVNQEVQVNASLRPSYIARACRG
jgi:hypothetical protein